MNSCRALWSHYLSEREHVFASGPGQWKGVEISSGVLESWLPILEEEGLEDGDLALSGSFFGERR